MPLRRWRVGGSSPVLAVAFAALLLAGAGVPPAHALRVVTWNLLQYPALDLAGREPHFRTVMASINADVLIAQELNTAAGSDSFLINVLNVVEPGQWAATAWANLSSGEGGTVFYKHAKVTVTRGNPMQMYLYRRVLPCIVKPVGYVSNLAGVRLHSIHLKAGSTSGDSTARRIETTLLRDSLNFLPTGTHLMVGGDSNIYGAYEGAYARLIESQLDDDGRMRDPLVMEGLITGTGNWHANSGYSIAYSQSPCATAPCPGSNGGVDDRFDLWLASYNLTDGEGLDYVTDYTISNGAYPYTYGNDGTKYNTDVNAGGTNGMVPIAVANALKAAADHLPVVITLQIPARVVAASELNFGAAIVGGSPTLNLAVSDGAAAPADELTYSFTPPAGFTAPGGTFAANPGAGPNNHAIGLSTATAGIKTGTLIANTDDPDSTSKPVLLSGTVLDHAEASLDSVSALLNLDVDFGDQEIGEFVDQSVRAHNRGWDALQARLSMDAANIIGGDGRFSIVGGFSPSLLSGVGRTFNLHFDDTGATLDQVYTATLTFSSSDEPLPGATAASDLVVSLRAKPVSGSVGVPGRDLPPDLPAVLAFHPPRPNPLAGETVFAFDLPGAAPVTLAIFDLSGRRVANLVSGSLEADRHQIRWDATAESGGRVPAGLYFARFSTPGLNRVTRLVVLP